MAYCFIVFATNKEQPRQSLTKGVRVRKIHLELQNHRVLILEGIRSNLLQPSLFFFLLLFFFLFFKGRHLPTDRLGNWHKWARFRPFTLIVLSFVPAF